MLSLLLNGWRSWKSAKGVALLSVAALAIGIGSTVAIYSVVRAVLLQPLPFSNPTRYLIVRGEWRGRPGFWTSFSYIDYLQFLGHTSTLDAYGCTNVGNFNVSFGSHALRVQGSHVTPSFMASLGIPFRAGRWFRTQEPGTDNVHLVVLSTPLWRRLGSDEHIVGKQITMNGARYSVSGVAPGWFHFPADENFAELWTPFNPADYNSDHKAHTLQCYAKTKENVAVSQARDDLDRIQSALQRNFPNQGEPDIITTTPLLSELVHDIRPRLLLLLAASLALLLITCANVGSLLLTRAVGRARETAVRVALGATVFQLGAQYFFEGFLVSVAGAFAGSLLSYALVRSVLKIAADRIPRADQIRFNWPVLGFALLVSAACGVLFSLSPLWQAIRTAPASVLSEGARTSASAGSRRLLRGFVVAEVALAFGLIAIGGLLLQQLGILYHQNLGFDPGRVLVVHTFAPHTKYPTLELQTRHREDLTRAINHIPGVEVAGFTSSLPLIGEGSNTWFRLEGDTRRDWANLDPASIFRVDPEYFRALKIPIIRGRPFNDSDTAGGTLSVLVNQTFAHKQMGTKDPVGAYIQEFDIPEKRLRVVGVVGDVRGWSLSEPVHQEVYFNFREMNTQHMMWAIRSSLSPDVLTPVIREAVLRIDPEEAIFHVRTMQEVIDDSVSGERLQSLMLSFFAAAALLLSTLGVYGVVSYSVRQRTTELGTRMAVGATAPDVLRLILGSGLKLAGAGIALGLLIVVASTHFLRTSELHIAISGIAPFLSAIVSVAMLTLFASWYPAWRAASLSPLEAIRDQNTSTWKTAGRRVRALASRLSAAVVHHVPDGGTAPFLAGIVGASRQADSFPDALHSALTAIQQNSKAANVLLLAQRSDGYPYRIVGSANGGDEGDSASISSTGLLPGRLRFVSSSLSFTPADWAALRAWASEFAPRHLDEIEFLLQRGITLALPILSKDEMLGMLLLTASSRRDYYTSAERLALSGAAQQLGLLLENGRLMERIFDQERLRRELLMATEVQKRLFPEHPLATDRVQLIGMCLPARGVGGDYYDFLELGGHQIGVALADVAGKGIAAAIIMSVVQASLRSLASSNGASLADLASRMNQLLHRSTGASSYATFFYSQLDQNGYRLRYVNAGHNPPFLLRGNEVIELPATGMIIGMFAAAAYEEAAIDILPGDTLLLFSDGVPEAHDPQEEEYGEDRLKALLQRTGALPLEQTASAILDDLKSWMSDAAQYDDLTFVLMRVK